MVLLAAYWGWTPQTLRDLPWSELDFWLESGRELRRLRVI